MTRPLLIPSVLLSVLLAGCASVQQQPVPESATQMKKDGTAMTHLAERYVKLVLAMGEHDSDYVDAFYGPAEWREEVRAAKTPVSEILTRARSLAGELDSLARPSTDLEGLRHNYLRRQTAALIARAEMLGGRTMTFDEESKALYDAVAPQNSEEHFQEILDELDRELPGTGSVADQLEEFRTGFIIPKEKIDAVFQAAIAGCRERTLAHIDLPPGESFTVEYVTNKSWSGYNWYQGNYRSLIQVNTDLPIYIDRAIDLACHEGYPGHHVYNVLLEKNLVKERGWPEFTVYALFSPQSLIAEGSANYGIDIAFPGEERIEWERKNLFPLAGISPTTAAQYYRVQDLLAKLGYAGNEAARRYLNGGLDAAKAAEWHTKYALMSPARAQQRVRFIDQYRSYVINYNLGKDLVRRYVEAVAGNDAEKRWTLFEQLLSSPRLPSGLKR